MRVKEYLKNDRGKASYSWLQSWYTFSFADYYVPNKKGFGKLRVLNDDVIKGGGGFETHPHKNMEIISIPLHGSLTHKDSEGHVHTIKKGDVQIMSAGTGIYHSEFNSSKIDEVNLLQIWVRPKNLNITPRYEQKSFDNLRVGRWQNIVCPLGQKEDGVKINQDAYFYIGEFDKDFQTSFKVRMIDHGIFLKVLEGMVKVEDHVLTSKDAIAMDQFEKQEVINIEMIETSFLLVIEVPMD